MNQSKINVIKKEFLHGHSLKLRTQDVMYLSSIEEKHELAFELANLYDTFVNDKDLEYLFDLLSS